ncbi:hypothetical protein H6P1_00738 (plasmid) [Variovorax sp. PBL-H6]|nr:hypothetical protein SRS16P1_00195 [Variovorax sp. SRS16]VTU42150.1 hypothetical protein E5P1_00193 [Variovorax sp. PBL-E5]VTU44353.1 hypothetical protein H6P1_00738 [Variovorax sp. PBL-H6]
MNLSSYPSRSFRKLWHQGSLNPVDKGVRGVSYEGAGLSVSQHPDAWEQIARLGGLPLWVLSRKDRSAGRFIDYRRLGPSQQHKLAQEGTRRGWLQRATRHRLQWTDPEVGDKRYCLFADEDKARAEADDIEQWAENITTDLIEMDVATPLLAKVTGQEVSDDLAVDMVLTGIVEELDVFDGVWWADRLDPANFSAPRGCISMSALCRWDVEQRAPARR